MGERCEAALVALRQIFRVTETQTRSLAKEFGLTPTQLLFMQVLSAAPRATASFVAKEMSVSHGTVTALTDRLICNGLMTRTKGEEDRRQAILQLTPEGEALLKAVPGSLQERFEDRFEALELWEQAFILAALERTASMLDASDIEASPILATGPLSGDR
ncbi:transcriptional regulator, MarR family protein [Parvularcula bermudensis HTCC2503]|uniref:Transcriptional regulator, MarR family protein n=1 Tax=Parvularcula bermudensis (strain ATCC BAA-594 / HTCC2503 / KCTC 12087) TaxID=314260 RepID=E0TGG1_PARBH|nr:transcriptional regulator, MarR family protein [Parvularcula bermudensis HTCC2503]